VSDAAKTAPPPKPAAMRFDLPTPGMAVEVAFQSVSEDVTIPGFRPAQ